MLSVSILHTQKNKINKSGPAQVKYFSHNPTTRKLSSQDSTLPKAQVLFNCPPEEDLLQPTLFQRTSKLFLKLCSVRFNSGNK